MVVKNNKDKRDAPNVKDYVRSLFKEHDIPCPEDDLELASNNLVRFFRLLHESKLEMEGKPQKEKPKVIRQTKRPSYFPVYMDAYRLRPKMSEFMNMLTKEQIMQICFEIEDFNKYKESINAKHAEEHQRMNSDPQYKEFLEFKHNKRAKPTPKPSEINFSSLSTSKVFEESEKMTLEQKILNKFIDHPEFDEYGLPYYP